MTAALFDFLPKEVPAGTFHARTSQKGEIQQDLSTIAKTVPIGMNFIGVSAAQPGLLFLARLLL